MMKRELLIAATAAALTAAGCAGTHAQRGEARHDTRPYDSGNDRYTGLVGPRGIDGPAGPAGEQGPAGPMGERGTVFAGPRGADGPMGPAGEQGPAGARGPEGALVAGPAGPAGNAGPAGARGAAGSAGPQGASTEGYAGAAGAAGPQGPRGEAGPAGERGPTLVGPTGPAGRPGSAGERGTAGEAGARGETSEGVAGATGRPGETGERGTAGPAGAEGAIGGIHRWTAYREIWFGADATDLDRSGNAKVAEIAKYLKDNPTLQVGIDASRTTRESDRTRSQRLVDDRVASISDALTKAGVPASRIKAGTFGDPSLRRDGRVAVLLSTSDERAQASQ